MAGYDRSTVKVYGTSIQETDGVIEIHSRFSIASPAKQPFLRLQAVWKVDLEGSIYLSLDGNFDKVFPARDASMDCFSFENSSSISIA